MSADPAPSARDKTASDQKNSISPKMLSSSPSRSTKAVIPPIKLNLDSPQMQARDKDPGSMSPVTPFNFDPLKSPSLPSQPPFYGHRTPTSGVTQQKHPHVGSTQGSMRSSNLRSPLALVPSSPVCVSNRQCINSAEFAVQCFMFHKVSWPSYAHAGARCRKTV